MQTKEIQLSNSVVEIKESLTWGDANKIQSVFSNFTKMSGKASDAENFGIDIDGAAMLEAKYVALECVVVKIKEDEKEKSFSRDWADNLSVEDGDKLYAAVEEITKKNQKG